MLLQLCIRNFAIIDEAELEFPAGFTVITGETGAGKSILVNALSLVLGGRASADLVRAGADAAEVEALFDISGHPVVRARLEKRCLVGDDLDLLLVRRVVAHRGRGRVVINGKLSTVAAMSEIVRGLVEISGQHEQQGLVQVDSHVDILDAHGELDGVRENYSKALTHCRRIERELRVLSQNEEESLRRVDFLRFQLQEIEQLAPQSGEREELEVERARLSHAEKLTVGTQLAESLLYGEDGSAFDKLGKAIAELQSLAKFDAGLANTVDSLSAARREIDEAARDLQHYIQGIDVDPQRLEEVENRCAQLDRLCRKHGGDLAFVLKRAEELGAELQAIDNADERLRALQDELDAASTDVWKQAAALTEARRQAATTLEKAVMKELAEIDLGEALLKTRIDGAEPGDPSCLTASGIDDVEFLWSANPGEPPKPLAKIASGGELSRLMLAFKSVLRNRDLVSMYVFDEVDTGLGGRAADAIGRKISRVARGHQAITITHLAPIAARADHHLRVAKHSDGQRTVSSFAVVQGKERAEEVARMIDGAEITRSTRQAAKEMLARR